MKLSLVFSKLSEKCVADASSMSRDRSAYFILSLNTRVKIIFKFYLWRSRLLMEEGKPSLPAGFHQVQLVPQWLCRPLLLLSELQQQLAKSPEMFNKMVINIIIIPLLVYSTMKEPTTDPFDCKCSIKNTYFCGYVRKPQNTPPPSTFKDIFEENVCVFGLFLAGTQGTAAL